MMKSHKRALPHEELESLVNPALNTRTSKKVRGLVQEYGNILDPLTPQAWLFFFCQQAF